MNLSEKLKKYVKDNGLQLQGMSKQLGMSRVQFYRIVSGDCPLPQKYWKKIIKMTNGLVTLGDILADRFKKLQQLEIKSYGFPDRCEISLKDFNER